ncbi:uncharacterized protein TRUGW13939_10268 [Talaromyces rugulosus]|uniref:FAD-binding domain-containing protein n=1 Tax=Talaromyces rugulosus TaxID=121627 RepID=A0A7H8R9L6_TALRU|nr:uncharacterized protein TRUGW13939_10268 [Talaromyces rugulosus]QKX63100.1 hypothetical protein TRUGW13939_10268 [Talaromyces rugulosus]
MLASNVIIIGAGLAGVTLALCLKKQHGISYSIYKLRPSPDECRTHTSPNVLRVLQYVSVYDKIRTQVYNYEEVGMNNASGQQLATFLIGSEKLYHLYSIRVHRKIVQLKLPGEAEEQGIAIHYGMKLIDVNEDNVSGVELIFENGITVAADFVFVVGADGVHSRTRSAVSNTAHKYSGLLGVTSMSRRPTYTNERKGLRELASSGLEYL